MFGSLSIVGKGKTESLGTDADRLVESMMGKERSSYLIASPFLQEVSSLAKGIGGGEVRGQA